MLNCFINVKKGYLWVFVEDEYAAKGKGGVKQIRNYLLLEEEYY